MPSLETPVSQENNSAQTTPAAPEATPAENENDENKAIENALKKETAGEKETLVDDLHAEIDVDEEDQE
jgi:hypothetical protein